MSIDVDVSGREGCTKSRIAAVGVELGQGPFEPRQSGSTFRGKARVHVRLVAEFGKHLDVARGTGDTPVDRNVCERLHGPAETACFPG